MVMDTKLPHIVVLGAGFGGLEFCRRMKGQAVRITLIDRQNHHLFQPLLYQVATAGLSAPEIAHPIRSIFREQENVHVLMDEATGIDPDKRVVDLKDTGSIHYDTLVMAVGARTQYFGNDQWERHAPGLKTLDDARKIRHRVLKAFEQAERERDADKRKRLMRLVVVGGGPTGVEMAGSFAELSKRVLARDFKNIDPAKAEIVLLEAAPRVLGSFPERLSASAKKQLESLGVQVRLNQKILDIQEGRIVLEDGAIEAETIVWGAGVRASPLCDCLKVEKDRAGRLQVDPDLSLPGYPDVYAVGDIVRIVDTKGQAVPGVSPAAMQMGRHVASEVKHKYGSQPGNPRPFTYFDKGNMATIGRSRAIAHIGPLKFSGFPAWMAWLAVHLIFLVGFRNKLAVLLQWVYSYVNFRRGARLITDQDTSFLMRNHEADTPGETAGQPSSRAG